MIEQLKKNKFKVLAIGCLLVIAMLGIFWKWHQTQERKAYQAQAEAAQAANVKYVQVFQVEQRKFKDALTGLMGTVKSSSIELKVSQDEVLLKYNFKPGDKVSKGQIIAEQDHTRTRSKLRQAQIALQRKRSLFEVGGASKTELEEAQEIVKLAKKDYDDTFIRAPKNGKLGEILVQEGELVNRQSTVAYFVSGEDYFYLEVSVIENHLSEIYVGQQAEVTAAALGSEAIAGQVVSVSPEITTSSRMIPVRIKLDKNYQKKLRPGLSASCSIITYNQDSVIIPKSTLINGQEKVLVVLDDQTLQERAIELGYESRDYTAVLQGLNEQELIVMRPAYADVKAGDKIRFGKPEVYAEK